MTKSIASLKEQMVKARADDAFLEPDLSAWTKKLEELKESLATYTLIAASPGYLAHVFNRKMGSMILVSQR